VTAAGSNPYAATLAIVDVAADLAFRANFVPDACLLRVNDGRRLPSIAVGVRYIFNK
jgi:hypothetical protein